MDVDSRSAWLKAQLTTHVNFDAGFLAALYEKLMSSLGKTGTLKNFQLNTCLLDQIIKNHYATERCIFDLSDDLAEERAKLFEPILHCLNKKGL